MNKLLIFLLSFIAIIFINSCESVKSGLSGQKKSGAEEFLVKKKNPLILPPDYEDMPVPTSEEKEELVYDDVNLDELLGKIKKESSKNKSSSKISTSTEKSILKKINKN